MFLHDYLFACEISTVRTQTLKNPVLYAYIISYYNFVILFIICIIHLDLCNIFMDFMYEIPFFM